MMRRHWWLALLVAGLLGLVGIAARMLFRSLGAEPENITLVKPLACSACGHYYQGAIARPPLKCPKCSQESVWPALKCAKCGAVVACDRHRFRRESRDPYCLKCGSTKLASIQSGELSGGQPSASETSR